MTQLAPEERSSSGQLEDQHPEFPHDAERFAHGLEDDRKLHRAWLIVGVVSEVALIGMLITSLQEPGRATPIVLAVLVAGLGLAMGVQATRFTFDGQPRTSRGNDTRSSTPQRAPSWTGTWTARRYSWGRRRTAWPSATVTHRPPKPRAR